MHTLIEYFGYSITKFSIFNIDDQISPPPLAGTDHRHTILEYNGEYFEYSTKTFFNFQHGCPPNVSGLDRRHTLGRRYILVEYST